MAIGPCPVLNQQRWDLSGSPGGGICPQPQLLSVAASSASWGPFIPEFPAYRQLCCPCRPVTPGRRQAAVPLTPVELAWRCSQGTITGSRNCPLGRDPTGSCRTPQDHRPPSVCPKAQGPERHPPAPRRQHSAGRWTHQVRLVCSKVSPGENTAHPTEEWQVRARSPRGLVALDRGVSGAEGHGVGRALQCPAVTLTRRSRP